MTYRSDGLRVIMMCEIPSNALLADRFLEHFDGFSIGSNDMTQLTLAVDRADERDVRILRAEMADGRAFRLHADELRRLGLAAGHFYAT